MPGRPSDTGSRWVFGSPPNWLGAAEKSLVARQQLGVDLEADDELPAVGRSALAAISVVRRS